MDRKKLLTEQVLALPRVQRHGLNDALGDRAAALAASCKLRGADAVFVALAEALDQPLITLDRRSWNGHLGSSKPKHPMFGCIASQAGNCRRFKPCLRGLSRSTRGDATSCAFACLRRCAQNTPMKFLDPDTEGAEARPFHGFTPANAA